MTRVLVAAFGNDLRGDDGFGIAVLRQLEAEPAGDGVRLLEVGTGGIRLAQELLTPCERLIIVDAVSRGADLGTLCVLQVDHVPDALKVEMHLAVPARALALAKALGAVTQVPDDPIARGDELLELLFWIEGEGFRGGAATLEAIARFIAYPPHAVRTTLDELVTRGDVAYDAASGEYRLSGAGRREGARRFAEDFAPLLAQGHGECNDPDCGCHADPSAAAECHARGGR